MNSLSLLCWCHHVFGLVQRKVKTSEDLYFITWLTNLKAGLPQGSLGVDHSQSWQTSSLTFLKAYLPKDYYLRGLNNLKANSLQGLTAKGVEQPQGWPSSTTKFLRDWPTSRLTYFKGNTLSSPLVGSIRCSVSFSWVENLISGWMNVFRTEPFLSSFYSSRFINCWPMRVSCAGKRQRTQRQR